MCPGSARPLKPSNRDGVDAEAFGHDRQRYATRICVQDAQMHLYPNRVDMDISRHATQEYMSPMYTQP